MENVLVADSRAGALWNILYLVWTLVCAIAVIQFSNAEADVAN